MRKLKIRKYVIIGGCVIAVAVFLMMSAIRGLNNEKGLPLLMDTEMKELVRSHVKNMIKNDPFLTEHRVRLQNIEEIETHPLLPTYYKTFYTSYEGVEFYAEDIFVINSINRSVSHLDSSNLNLLLNKIGREIQKKKDVIKSVEYYLLLKSIYSSQWYVLIKEPMVIQELVLKKPQIKKINRSYVLKGYIVSGINVGGGYPLNPESETVRKRTILFSTYHINPKGEVDIMKSEIVKEGLLENLPRFQISEYTVKKEY